MAYLWVLTGLLCSHIAQSTTSRSLHNSGIFLSAHIALSFQIRTMSVCPSVRVYAYLLSYLIYGSNSWFTVRHYARYGVTGFMLPNLL